MASMNAPLGVEDIVKQASNYEYNVQIPLRYWLRTADTMQKEVCIEPFPISRSQLTLHRPKFTKPRATTLKHTFSYTAMHNSSSPISPGTLKRTNRRIGRLSVLRRPLFKATSRNLKLSSHGLRRDMQSG